MLTTVFAWVASRANMLYLAAHTHNRAAVYTRLVLEFCCSCGPSGYPRKHRFYHKTLNLGAGVGVQYTTLEVLYFAAGAAGAQRSATTTIANEGSVKMA